VAVCRVKMVWWSLLEEPPAKTAAGPLFRKVPKAKLAAIAQVIAHC
jgi:hypothetical protein